MSDIFISYASEDRPRVEPLAKALEEQGWSVWWDRTIPPGKTFDQVIEEAINAARCVVVLWSKRSIKSDWVKEEANIAKERKILVPAMIDPVDLPLGFGRIQAADLIDWEVEKGHPGYLSLRKAISEVAGPPPERDKSVEVTQLPESNPEQEVETKDSKSFQPDPSHLKTDTKESPLTGPKAPRKIRLAFGIGAAALILILSVIGWFLFSKHTITAKAGNGGSILPSGPVSVSYFSNKKFTIKPDSGYRLKDVMVDGISVGEKSTYTIKNVTDNRTISASFAVISYKITASSSSNGSISPSGEVSVSYGDSKRFEITPSSGYRIADVQVDGKSVGAVSRYEFNDITSDHKVSASFAKIGRHKITLGHVGAFVAKFYVNWKEKSDKGDLVPKSYASGNKTAGYRHEIVFPGDAQDIRVQAQVKTGLVWDPWRHHYKNYPSLDEDKFLKLSGTTSHSSFAD